MPFEMTGEVSPFPRYSFAAIMPLTSSSHSNARLVLWYSSFNIVPMATVNSPWAGFQELNITLLISRGLKRVDFAIVKNVVYGILEFVNLLLQNWTRTIPEVSHRSSVSWKPAQVELHRVSIPAETRHLQECHAKDFGIHLLLSISDSTTE